MIYPKVRNITLVLIVLFLSVMGILKSTDEADAVGDLKTTIELDMVKQEVDVDPQRGGIVTFTGKVVTQQWRDVDFQFAFINLTASCDAGWEVTEIPVLTVSRLGLRDPTFSVSVSVPQMETATEQSEIHKLTVSGQWRYEPALTEIQSQGNIEAAEALIYVNQVYQYSISSEPGYVQTAPGGQFDIKLVIQNTGNGADEIDVVIENRDRKEDNGWAFIMNRTHYELPFRGRQEINIKVTTPNRWDGWRNVISVIRFQVTSSQASQNSDVAEVVYYSVYVRQRGVSIPGFEVPLLIAAVLACALLTIRRRR
jgi:hypothetical protein